MQVLSRVKKLNPMMGYKASVAGVSFSLTKKKGLFFPKK